MKRLIQDIKGATAVEFALIAPLFFAVIFSFIETGWVLSKVVMLEQSVASASRLVYTGQAPTKESLETQLCDQNPLIEDCLENINVEMVVISDFNDEPDDAVECRDSADTSFEPTVKYSSTAGSEIVYLRVCVTTGIMVPGIGMGLALDKNNTGRFQIVSSTAFMNEPF